MMGGVRSLITTARRSNGKAAPVHTSSVRRRRLAIASNARNPTLPLAGIRVLDMTRVLAGVGLYDELRIVDDVVS
jgi:hypothetical protein